MDTNHKLTHVEQTYLYDITFNLEKFQKVPYWHKNKNHEIFYEQLPKILTNIENHVKDNHYNVNASKKIVGISILILGALGLIFTTVALSTLLFPFAATLVIGSASIAAVAVGIYFTILGSKNPVETILDHEPNYQATKHILNGEYEKAIEIYKICSDSDGFLNIGAINRKINYGLKKEIILTDKELVHCHDVYLISLSLYLRELQLEVNKDSLNKDANNIIASEKINHYKKIAENVNGKIPMYFDGQIAFGQYWFSKINKNLKTNFNELSHFELKNLPICSLKETPDLFTVTLRK